MYYVERRERGRAADDKLERENVATRDQHNNGALPQMRMLAVHAEYDGGTAPDSNFATSLLIISVSSGEYRHCLALFDVHLSSPTRGSRKIAWLHGGTFFGFAETCCGISFSIRSVLAFAVK